METTLTSTIKNISPILYDLTVTPLPEDPIEPLKEADLITSISTDNYTPQINDTIKIILNVGNNGPNNTNNVKVTYKLPFGMEYLSTNGNYDAQTGLWTIDNLNNGSTTTLEILAKILNTGNLVNIETVTGLEYDPISANNQAKLTLNIPYVDPDNHIPEVPSNLPDNGMATLPPIPNIENLMDLDIYQPGTNPIPPNNPPNPPKPDTPDPNPPGPNPPGPPDKPGPNPPNPTDPNRGPLNTPTSQLARDISYIRDYLSYNPSKDTDGNKNTQPQMPGWNVNPNEPDEKIEKGEIPSWVYVALASAILIAAISIKKPEWGTAILNSLRTVWNVMKYLGGSTRLFVDKVLTPNLKNIFKITGPEDAFKSFSAILDGLNPNIDSTILKEFLKQIITKLFPNSAPLIDISIDMIFSGISLAELINDPLGKIENIINILNPYHTDKQDDYESLTDPRPF